MPSPVLAAPPFTEYRIEEICMLSPTLEQVTMTFSPSGSALQVTCTGHMMRGWRASDLEEQGHVVLYILS